MSTLTFEDLIWAAHRRQLPLDLTETEQMFLEKGVKIIASTGTAAATEGHVNNPDASPKQVAIAKALLNSVEGQRYLFSIASWAARVAFTCGVYLRDNGADD